MLTAGAVGFASMVTEQQQYCVKYGSNISYQSKDKNFNAKQIQKTWRKIDSMAELHILGQLHGVSDFRTRHSLFCRYSFQSGPNWTVISGSSEGQSVSAKPDHDDKIVWTQPLDIHYITKGIQGWPKLILQISCLDAFSRSWIVGYSCCSLPAVPGHHSIKVPCWAPAATNLSDRLKQYFLGGSPQLLQTDLINLGLDRYKLHTESKGNLFLQVDIILRNFSQFGIEYK